MPQTATPASQKNEIVRLLSDCNNAPADIKYRIQKALEILLFDPMSPTGTREVAKMMAERIMNPLRGA